MGNQQILTQRDRLRCVVIWTVFVYRDDDLLSRFVCAMDETGFICPTALEGIHQGLLFSWSSNENIHIYFILVTPVGHYSIKMIPLKG